MWNVLWKDELYVINGCNFFGETDAIKSDILGTLINAKCSLNSWTM